MKKEQVFLHFYIFFKYNVAQNVNKYFEIVNVCSM